MVRFCRRCEIKVAARGEHHTTHGQGLTDGLVIEMAALNTIHSISPDGADVDAGVLWRDLIKAAFAQGLRRPGLTGYTGLSVGGVLSVGGCPLSNDEGAVVDRVRELTVVTGKGDLVRCSATHSQDLFEAALGGLGQCGIIVRALVDLVPAKPMARTFLLHYLDPKAFWQDFRTLVRRGECNDVYNVCVPPGSSVFVYEINATVFFDPAAPPDNAHLMRGLTLPAIAGRPARPAVPHLHAVRRHADRRPAAHRLGRARQAVVRRLAARGRGRGVRHRRPRAPQARGHRPDGVHPALRAAPLEAQATVLACARRRARRVGLPLRRPQRVGAARPEPGFARKMLDRNRRWFERGRDARRHALPDRRRWSSAATTGSATTASSGRA